MNLKQHLSVMSQADRERFALDCGTTLGHLRNVMYGYRPCSPELASAIELTSRGAVTRITLCPGNWHRIWPELAQSGASTDPVASESVVQGVA